MNVSIVFMNDKRLRSNVQAHRQPPESQGGACGEGSNNQGVPSVKSGAAVRCSALVRCLDWFVWIFLGINFIQVGIAQTPGIGQSLREAGVAGAFVWHLIFLYFAVKTLSSLSDGVRELWSGRKNKNVKLQKS